jgi:heat shock protein HslJ
MLYCLACSVVFIFLLAGCVSNQINEQPAEQPRSFDSMENKVKTSFTGTHWLLDELGSRAWSEVTDRPAYLLFNPDRTMEGFSGCNKISGTFLLRDEMLQIERVVQTRMACPGSMEGEYRLISALDKVRSYRIGDNVLELIDPNDQVLARFLAGP